MSWLTDIFRPSTKPSRGPGKPDQAAAPVVSPFASGAAANFAAGYEVVSDPYDRMRREAVIETRGEDRQLPAAKRARLTNLQRDMLRNSPVRIGQDQQQRVNVVGSVGGKLYAAFPNSHKAAAEEVMEFFNKRWFPKAEYTYRENFNWILKTALTAQDVGGNVILVFDDGILTGGNGTGRIRGFEGDEIADVPKLEDYFPKSCMQSQGFVYNAYGMFCGAFVSTSQRGRSVFAPEQGVLKLSVDPFDDDAIPNWIAIGPMLRFNQGRSVPPTAAALATLIDLHETNANEAQASKFNAQLVGQVLHDAGSTPSNPVPSAFDDNAVSGTGAGAQPGTDVKKVVLDKLRAIGIRYQDMPEGLKMELFDTKRPNSNLPAYIDYLAGLCGGVKGMARVFSILKAQTSYTAFRGEQVMTEPSFDEARRDLERKVCDWAARCVIRRAAKLGLIKPALPDGWEYMLAWRWPKMREVSEKDAQEALSKKLANGVTSLTRELGPGEFEKIMAERLYEKKMFDEAGLVYPGETTVSGAVKDDIKNDDGHDDSHKEKPDPDPDAGDDETQGE